MLTRPLDRRHTMLWLTLISAAGAALRLIALAKAPPGLHYDEAVYGLQALDIVRGARPVYFSSYTGREPLYMYLMAVVFRMGGVGALQLRLTSALIGIATIPLVYWLASTLFDRRIGLLAATLTALSYWHLTVSRNGYPNILIPPLECLSMLYLWKGYREKRAIWMGLGGAFMGLVLYSYLAARFYPITAALFFLYAMLVDWPRFRANFWRLALAAAVCVLVFAPLGLHFIHNPADFSERASQVLVFDRLTPSQIPTTLLANLAKTLAGLVIKGDPRTHFNLPDKAVFSAMLAPFFLLGLGICLKRWRRIEYALLPIWLVGMCLPAILTSDLMPQGQRMFGIIPAIYAMAALGIDAALLWSAKSERRPMRAWAAALLAALIVFEATYTSVTYFGVWARQARTFYAFHGDHVLLGDRAKTAVETGYDVVIQCREYKHPAIVLAHPEALGAAWVSGGHVLLIPNREDVRYLVTAESLKMHGKIRRRMAQLIEPIEALPGPDGSPAVQIGRISPETVRAHLAMPAVASFADEIEVIDWELPSGVARNEPLSAMVQWRVSSVAPGRVLATHLVDANGIRWAQDRKMGYFPEHWQPGDSVYQVFEMTLPEGIPAGTYTVELLLEREEGGLLPVARDGDPISVTLPLGQVELELEGATIAPRNPSATLLAPGLGLLAHDPLPETASLGSQVQFMLTWQAQDVLAADYTVDLQLVDAAGQAMLAITQPICVSYPADRWQVGEVVRCAYALPLGDLGRGDYELQVSLRDQTQYGHVTLGRLTVAGEPRLFEAPPISHPASATFGSEVALLGYDLGEVVDGQPLALTLYWQALSVPQGDYKVFVHLADKDGHLLAQHDAAPADWSRPTLGWVQGEIVIDDHVLALQPGTNVSGTMLYVGMYDANTLQRLPISNAGGTPIEDHRLWLRLLDAPSE